MNLWWKRDLAIDTYFRLFRKTSTTQICHKFVSTHLAYLKSQSLKFLNKETPFLIKIADLKIDMHHMQVIISTKLSRTLTIFVSLPTARVGNVFTRVCDSVHNGLYGYLVAAHPCWLLGHSLLSARIKLECFLVWN